MSEADNIDHMIRGALKIGLASWFVNKLTFIIWFELLNGRQSSPPGTICREVSFFSILWEQNSHTSYGNYILVQSYFLLHFTPSGIRRYVYPHVDEKTPLRPTDSIWQIMSASTEGVLPPMAPCGRR